MRVLLGIALNKLGGYDENNSTAKAIKNELYSRILELVTVRNFDTFIVGGALGVDTWAAEAVIDLKGNFNDLKLYLYRPFVGQERVWNNLDRNRYLDILDKCNDVITVCDGGYEPWKMQERNMAMINDSDLVVAVWDGSRGGTGNCVAYAIKKAKEIWRIDPRGVGSENISDR